MKPNIRVLGIDDGPFTRGVDSKTVIVGVLMRMDGVIESIHIDFITIDGDEAQSVISSLVESIGHGNINVILTEGITFAGFDIIDPEELYNETGIPFISITKGKADLDSMAAALEAHGNSNKIAKLKSLKPVKETLENTQFTLNMSGINTGEAISLVKKLMTVGNVPEPLRIADMIAFSLGNKFRKIP